MVAKTWLNCLTGIRNKTMKTNNYVSSITSKYDDIDNVKTDAKALRDIHSRQGSSLLIDVISELAGEVSNEMNLSNEDRSRLVTNLVNKLTESLLERL